MANDQRVAVCLTYGMVPSCVACNRDMPYFALLALFFSHYEMIRSDPETSLPPRIAQYARIQTIQRMNFESIVSSD